jgi:multicomponent Na+:H+ antiporter subunit C
MTTGFIYALAGVLLFVLGAVGVVVLKAVLRKILAFNVMGSGAFLVLVGLAQRDGGTDPVPQAMVLTGIVVAVAATALALALARRLCALEDEARSSGGDGDA